MVAAVYILIICIFNALYLMSFCRYYAVQRTYYKFKEVTKVEDFLADEDMA